MSSLKFFFTFVLCFLFCRIATAGVDGMPHTEGMHMDGQGHCKSSSDCASASTFCSLNYVCEAIPPSALPCTSNAECGGAGIFCVWNRCVQAAWQSEMPTMVASLAPVPTVTETPMTAQPTATATATDITTSSTVPTSTTSPTARPGQSNISVDNALSPLGIGIIAVVAALVLVASGALFWFLGGSRTTNAAKPSQPFDGYPGSAPEMQQTGVPFNEYYDNGVSKVDGEGIEKSPDSMERGPEHAPTDSASNEGPEGVQVIPN